MELLRFNISTRFQQCLLICAILITAIFLFTFYSPNQRTGIFFRSLNFIRSNFSPLALGYPPNLRSAPIILLWTTRYRKTNWIPSVQSLQCSANCHITSDRRYLNESEAIIFHLRSIKIKDLPAWEQNSSQKWILFNKEAPPNTAVSVIQALEGKIHWTATYRRDSDFHTPYGVVVSTNETQTSTGFSAAKKKSYLVCWIVSHCQTSSQRESYVRILRQYVPVAIYGKCGSKKCPDTNMERCYHHISKECKFYLSFENSICTDYATEKLFNALKTDMVPIVMGGDNYSLTLPKNSYINTMDFRNPKAIAEYLIELDNNPNKFETYHMWKKKYKVEKQEFKWICTLCQRLHQNFATSSNAYENLTSWWFNQRCPNWRKAGKNLWR